ncbi:MAG: hypothetical protein AAF630_17345 [Cyanobacteria bacterium P01_C01_bin.38]
MLIKLCDSCSNALFKQLLWHFYIIRIAGLKQLNPLSILFAKADVMPSPTSPLRSQKP